MKPILLTITLLFLLNATVQAQLKEAAQLATLTPTIFVARADIENYKKLHYTVSAMTYLAVYSMTDSIWKSAAITLALGLTKELVYDGLLGKGEVLAEDMLWNGLGVGQGLIFTISLEF